MQARIEELEGAGSNKAGSNQEVKSLHLQLARLGPAKKPLIFLRICDVKLPRRTLELEVFLSETVGCLKPVGAEQVHEGKQGARPRSREGESGRFSEIDSIAKLLCNY